MRRVEFFKLKLINITLVWTNLLLPFYLEMGLLLATRQILEIILVNTYTLVGLKRGWIIYTITIKKIEWKTT